VLLCNSKWPRLFEVNTVEVRFGAPIYPSEIIFGNRRERGGSGAQLLSLA